MLSTMLTRGNASSDHCDNFLEAFSLPMPNEAIKVGCLQNGLGASIIAALR